MVTSPSISTLARHAPSGDPHLTPLARVGHTGGSRWPDAALGRRIARCADQWRGRHAAVRRTLALALDLAVWLDGAQGRACATAPNTFVLGSWSCDAFPMQKAKRDDGGSSSDSPCSYCQAEVPDHAWVWARGAAPRGQPRQRSRHRVPRCRLLLPGARGSLETPMDPPEPTPQFSGSARTAGVLLGCAAVAGHRPRSWRLHDRTMAPLLPVTCGPIAAEYSAWRGCTQF